MPIVNGLGEPNMAGHTIDDAGNTQVDFVWGNFPLQPNTGRDVDLDPELDNHEIVTRGYSNYPQFIADYEGDEDQGLEAVVPAIRGLKYDDAQAAVVAAGLTPNVTWVSPAITALSNVGKVVTITVDDTYGFVPGDIISGFYTDGIVDGVQGTFTDAKITAVGGMGGELITATLKTAITPDVDIEADAGSALFVNYVSTNDTRYVLTQATEAGTIVDAGSDVAFTILVNND